MNITRRDLLVGGASLAAGASVSAPFFLPKYRVDRRPKRSRVAILHAEQYSQKLDQILAAGLRLFPINVRGKTVVLKPNLVDYAPGDSINTHPMLVLAAAESFRCLGAKYVIVAEGPGHQRDTQLVLSQSGYQQYLRDEKIRFVDLNRDELIRTPLRSRYMRMRDLWLPRTVLEADFLVSMPKIKTHHWAGVTLSMKNMFGIVPGSGYGWPKNILHWKGIQESVLDLCATICDLRHKFAVRQGYGLYRSSDCLATSASSRAKCLNQHCSSHYLFCIPGNFMLYGCELVRHRPT